MQINLSNDELNTVRYAMDQHTMTLRDLLKADVNGTAIVPEVRVLFQGYIDNMQALLEKLPEV